MAFTIRMRDEPLHLDAMLIARASEEWEQDGCVFLNRTNVESPPSGATPAAVLVPKEGASELHGVPQVVLAPEDLESLSPGDILGLHPDGRLDILFKSGSLDNALFLTDRCNSNCLMCSQPPKDRDDLDARFEINTRIVELIPKDTEFLGITGGEPTLLGWRLLRLFRQIGRELPDTQVQMLTNGRAFAWPSIARAVSQALSGPTIFCVPLYSDHAWQHDYIVQARGAFEQTMLGLHNLARLSVPIEIRVVLHAQTVQRLPALAEFIHRNLPFTEHIALMGLEYTGYTPHNNELLWMEPEVYHSRLRRAVKYLADFGMSVSLYNLPLCLLPEDLWWCARSSISDWKRLYAEECQQCEVRKACGGLFATSRRQSSRIRAVKRIHSDVG